MPWQKGHPPHPDAGRRGYEFEQKQLEEMREMLTDYLAIIKGVLKNKATTDDYAKLTTIGADMRKILDKLHASKSETKFEGSIEEIQTVDEETKKFIDEYVLWRKSQVK